MNDEKTNGCGPEWLGSVKNDEFTDACNAHDIDTENRDKPVIQVHQSFLRGMLEIAKNNPNKWWLKAKAYIYFVLVVIFGWISYYGPEVMKWFVSQ